MRLIPAVAAAALGALGLGGAAPATAGHWLNAIEVPGTAALNDQGPFPAAEMISMSCPSGGSCAAGGFYSDRTNHSQAFVVSQRGDRWRAAIKVAGNLNKQNAAVAAVSCASAGNCVAGGTYEGLHFGTHGFVLTQRNGKWGRAVAVPGTQTTRVPFSEVTSISCTAGGCVAGGDYAAHNVRQPFVAIERNGRWRTASTLPGVAALNVGGLAILNAVLCTSAGNCVAAGGYAPSRYLGNPFGHEVFVATERNGRWGRAREVRTPASRITGYTTFSALSCPRAGTCTLAGTYTGSSGASPTFVISERNGRWGKPVPVRGIGIESLSCPAPGNCAASGSISMATQESQAYLLTERNGRWGKAFEVPGTARLNVGKLADATAVSCWSAGHCVAGGTYMNAASNQAFVVTDQNGRWATAFEVPGSGKLNTGRNATVTVISCTARGECGVGGDYTVQSGSASDGEVFVATRT